MLCFVERRDDVALKVDHIGVVAAERDCLLNHLVSIGTSLGREGNLSRGAPPRRVGLCVIIRSIYNLLQSSGYWGTGHRTEHGAVMQAGSMGGFQFNEAMINLKMNNK